MKKTNPRDKLLREFPFIYVDNEIIPVSFRYLTSFVERNRYTGHINYKIHYLLHKPFTFVNAFARVSKNRGALSKGVISDEETMRFFGLSNAETIAKQFRENKYEWRPSRRTLIPKPGKSKKRPIDTPTQKDRIVQEALRGILEAIYEPEFREFEYENSFQCTNYGFRPQKSCWTAVDTLKIRGQSSTYAIEGDIVGAYNNVNHNILISILENRIKDKKFIKLIRKLLISGIMEKNTFKHNLKGTPQGGILSPLLFNIYMFELDKFIYKEIIQPVNKLNKLKPNKKRNPIYQKRLREIKLLRLKLQSINRKKDYLETTKLRKQIKQKTKLLFKTPSYQINTIPKNYVYTRYADDWVLLINGSKIEAIKIKEKIKNFIQSTLDMSLDLDKTKISPLMIGFNFLGFSIKMYDNKQQKIIKVLTKVKNQPKRVLRRTTSRKISIIPDKERLLLNLRLKGFCNNTYYPIGKRSWTVYEPYEIVLKYRQIMLGIHNYYSHCDNYYILNRVSYILQYSCAKTIATRQKITTPQIFSKYGSSLRINKTFYYNSKEFKRTVEFCTLKSLKERKNLPLKEYLPFKDPFHITEHWRTKFKIYYNCCICDSNDRVGMHHLNSLRSIKPGKRDKFEHIRSQTQRTQIPVCHNCHLDITNGKYDNKKPIEFYNLKLAQL